MSDLSKKSIHDLRTIAQSFGVSGIFEKDSKYLIQEIELKQQNLIPPTIPLPPRPEYDARLMTSSPAQRGSMEDLTTLLEPYIKMGLRLKFDVEEWQMTYLNKSDSGTIRMPLRDALACARRLMQ